MKKLAEIRTSHTREPMKNVSIGEYTYGNPRIMCFNPEDKLTIGKFCSIAEGVTILIGMNHLMHVASTYPFGPFMGVTPPKIEEENKFKVISRIKSHLGPNSLKEVEEKSAPQETIIGNDVWIGFDALILSGVTIGDGAVIGARAVVSKDVEPYSIVAGSPLKHLRYRFPKDVREALLKKKWWDLPDEKIEEIAPYLLHPDISKLLEKL